jgi:molybdate transport system ATP-binding protein
MTLLKRHSISRKLKTFSSGERKKIYLDYCIKQDPEYIILDNPLDHLDQESRKTIQLPYSN